MFLHRNHRGARKIRRGARNGNLFEQIMKENFSRLLNEIDLQEVQEAQRTSKKLDPRKHTPRFIIITLPKIKEQGENLKSSKRKGDSYLQRSSHKAIS